MGTTETQVWCRIMECPALWRTLCRALLGEALFLLHEIRWGCAATDFGTAAFFRRLFRASWMCDLMRYD